MSGAARRCPARAGTQISVLPVQPVAPERWALPETQLDLPNLDMRHACAHAWRMNIQRPTRHLQIRDVPVAVHEDLVQRARDAGMSLSEYLRRELQETARRLSMKDLYQRIKSRDPVKPGLSSAEIIRLERDNR